MKKPLVRQLTVMTPEQVPLQYETAGIGSRAGAQLIDWLLLIVFYALLFGAWVGVTELLDMDWKKGQVLLAALLIVVFVVQYGYFWLMEFFQGGTIGKRVVGLRVIQDNGQPLTFLSAALRNLFRVLDMLPVWYIAGMAASFFHPLDKRIGDMVAGTVVVYDEPSLREKRERRIEKTISRGWRPMAIVLSEEQRRWLTEDDWTMLSLFIEQLPGFSMLEREQLAQRLARHLRHRLRMPQELNAAGYTAAEAPFLVALYKVLREDWELPG